MKIRVLLQLDLRDLSKLSLRVLGISLGLHVHDLHFFIFLVCGKRHFSNRFLSPHFFIKYKENKSLNLPMEEAC